MVKASSLFLRKGGPSVSEYYRFVLFEVRGIGLVACLFLPNQYRHEEILDILKRQFSHDDYHRLASGIISSGSDGNRHGVLVHELCSLREFPPLRRVMQITIEFFARTSLRAMGIVRERLSGEGHVDHRDEVVFMI
ncbi:MAG: hypothetical protein KA054_01320 [Candidatus Moranbacteria bacterium]|nr:hypothetical protein [Candidatus Moranbacteria bacterium]